MSFKSLLKAIKSFRDSVRKRSLKKLAVRSIRQSKYLYEPVSIDGRFFQPRRDWRNRWQAIEAEILRSNVNSLLDIGCAEGYFARLAAEKYKVFSIGIESNNKRICPAELSRIYDDVEKFAVVKDFLDPESIRKLPKFDMVILLSVLHHVYRRAGHDEAISFLSAVRSITNKCVIFEMGTSEEKKNDWADQMPTQKDGQLALLTGLLKEAGYAEITQIAITPGIKGDAPRIMVSATPGMA